MNNREMITKVLTAFDNNDTETILAHMADDVTWVMAGYETVSGKQAVEKFFADNADTRVTYNKMKHLIIDGDLIAAHGESQCTNTDGKVYNMYYCDVYELSNGKIKQMTTYTVERK